MKQPAHIVDRRRFLTSLGAIGLAAGLPGSGIAAPGPRIERAIPASGERLPVIGMGSWITFDVGDDRALRDMRVQVLRAFFAAGGAVIDTSPMYGSSEAVIGYCLSRLKQRAGPFCATKIWTPMQWHGVQQMATSHKLWGRDVIDLIQVHNLVNWEAHLESLQEAKAAGRIRYLGITTSHGRRHGELAQILAKQLFDFVQVTYNMLDREAEKRLLPLAAEHGLAVIVNRPFRRGQLFERFAKQPLPDWARDFDAANWAQFFLKFIVSHPAVTCAIPATSRVDHMRENMGAAYGRLPDTQTRRRMVRYVEAL